MKKNRSTTSNRDCTHWYVCYGICLACNSIINPLETKPFYYHFMGFCLSHEAISFTKRFTTLISLHYHKKLHLILDLDHTLLHTAKISNLAESEMYLIEEDESRQDLWNNMRGYLIKLRPFLREFLKEANELFNMTVYTKGSSSYASIVMKLIDPEMNYFGRRVITRKESPDLKTLDMVLVDERGVLIVDDSVESWANVDKRNLLQIRRYAYFRYGNLEITRGDKSYAEEKSDEKESNEGGLVNVLKLLKEIHGGFFSCEDKKELDYKDVRLLLQDTILMF